MGKVVSILDLSLLLYICMNTLKNLCWIFIIHFFIIITCINYSCLFLLVIDDALCEQRLWDMKYRGVQNFYMCEIRKDFTIDATFKGNFSRFLNHGCDPNCMLEKWLVWLIFCCLYFLYIYIFYSNKDWRSGWTYICRAYPCFI